MKKSLLCFVLPLYLFLLIQTGPVFAGVTPNVPGLVPLEYGMRPATDLIYDNRILTSDEAHILATTAVGSLKEEIRPEDFVFIDQFMDFTKHRPLTFYTQPIDEQKMLHNLVVYEVLVTADQYIDIIKVQVVATDAEGNTISGVIADTSFKLSAEEKMSSRLFAAEPQANPYPEGLEERPYASLDRMSFNIAAELVDAYKAGISAGNQTAAPEEVKVVLLTKQASKLESSQIRAIQSSLQQAIVSNRGFTCAISQDFHRGEIY